MQSNEQPLPPKIINAGVDTFLVNYKFAGDNDKPNGSSLPDHIITQLNDWQALARKEHDVVATDLLFSYTVGDDRYEQTLLMRPHGSGIWSWLVYSDDIRLSLSYGSMNGGVFCQARFSAHLLWSIGPESALVALDAMLYDFLGAMVYKQASEIHLCADVQGWDVSSLDWQNAFVSRVVRIRERPELPTEEELAGGLSPSDIRKLEASISEGLHGDDTPAYVFPTTVHRRIATLDFGSHGSNISCQIYNKSAEIKAHKKDWFLPIWEANGYDPTLTVWRVEFRIKRKFLATFDLNEAFSVLGQLELLWKYCTEEWLRYVDLGASSDTNKSRLPSHPAWEVIQGAYTCADETAATRDAEGEHLARLASLLHKKPLAVLEQAACLALEETAVTLPEDASLREFQAVAASFQHEPPDVIASLAQEALEKLSRENLVRLVLYLSPEPFVQVLAGLVKRSRTMAKRKACIAGMVGYMRSAVALAGDEVGGSRPGASDEEQQAVIPDMMASMIWAFGQVQLYDDKKGRVHEEEILKKRLAYNFITAKQLEHQRAHYGVSLHRSDWSEVAQAQEALRAHTSNVWLNPGGSHAA